MKPATAKLLDLRADVLRQVVHERQMLVTPNLFCIGGSVRFARFRLRTNLGRISRSVPIMLPVGGIAEMMHGSFRVPDLDGMQLKFVAAQPEPCPAAGSTPVHPPRMTVSWTAKKRHGDVISKNPAIEAEDGCCTREATTSLNCKRKTEINCRIQS
ncbi:uncharacterized protein LOC109401906 isoform X1 [Aedes albopictus]|uniref:Secreted protein n=1 Tax=Aedes albopictus TaxID=7160 RepID=A0ABM1XV95_AEDAL|nr:uncharacterized protein LOC109401906 [Aedes albopictus]